jgi:hypothetical protein
MRNRTGLQAVGPGPARPSSPPATHIQRDRRDDHDGHPEDDHQTSLYAYIARLVDAAPPLTNEQRDTLALLLSGPHRR